MEKYNNDGDFTVYVFTTDPKDNSQFELLYPFQGFCGLKGIINRRYHEGKSAQAKCTVIANTEDIKVTRVINRIYTIGDYSGHATLEFDSLTDAMNCTCTVNEDEREFVVSQANTDDWTFHYTASRPQLIAIIEPNAGTASSDSRTEKIPLTPQQLEALENSFIGDLTPKGRAALASLRAYIVNIRKPSSGRLYSPIASVAQSSGMGKSKLAYELLRQMPGIYHVFRAEGSSGYPKMNEWSKTLLESWHTSSDDYSENAMSNVGLFLRYLRLLVNFYIAGMNQLCSSGASIIGAIGNEAQRQVLCTSDMLAKYCGPNDISMFDKLIEGAALKYPNLSSVCKESISEITISINASNAKFYTANGLEENLPFLLVFDELSLLKGSETRASGFQIIRRALHHLGKTKIFALALGTDIEISEFRPRLSDPSSRGLPTITQVKPFIPSFNYDVLWGYVDPQDANYSYLLERIIVDDTLLLNRRHCRLLVSLGRPLWSSVPLNTVCELSISKLCNGHLQTGEPYLAIWAIRAGINIVPTHKIARKMVESYMATYFYASQDGSQMLIGYPSDPMLAYAASAVIEKHGIDALFANLNKFFDNGAVDTGRLGESISAMLLLLAMDDCKAKWLPPKLLDCEVGGLGHINDLSRKKIFMGKDDGLIAKAADAAEMVTSAEAQQVDGLTPLMSARTVGCFLKSLYGADVVGKLLAQTPELKSVLEAIVNVTHIVPLSRKWYDPSDKNMQSLPTYDNDNSHVRVIDDVLLRFGLLRGVGYFMPPNYYGIDIIIPYYMVEEKVRGYMSIQVKTLKNPMSKVEVTALLDKMRPSVHFATCPICQTPNPENCQSCVGGIKSLNMMKRCHLALTMSVGNEFGNRRGSSSFSGEEKLKNGVYTCKQEYSKKTPEGGNLLDETIVGISSYGTEFMSFLTSKARGSIATMYSGRDMFDGIDEVEDRATVASMMREIPLLFPEAYSDMCRAREQAAEVSNAESVSLNKRASPSSDEAQAQHEPARKAAKLSAFDASASSARASSSSASGLF